jgi:DNA-binding transcriptional MerR regulator
MANPQPIPGPEAPAGKKSPEAFRTINEVASELDLPQHVLRFWETRFATVRPLKRSGGRRYYRPEDVDLLRRIRDLLRDKGYTIKGVQKLLRQKSDSPSQPEDATHASSSPPAILIPSAVDPQSTTSSEVDEAISAPVIVAPEGAPSSGNGPIEAGLDADTRSELAAILAELEALRALIKGSPAR